MIGISQTAQFTRWIKGLKDGRARQKVAVRVRRLAFGNPGDIEPVGRGVSELRIDHGPGYRVYLVRRGEMIVLLGGGTKKTQARDIAKAKELAKEVED